MKLLFLFILSLCVYNYSVSQTQLRINKYPLLESYSILSLDEANRLFEEIKHSDLLDYNYTRGGCDYRAHAVYIMLKNMGVSTFKIWHFPECKIFIAGDYRLLKVRDKIDLSTDGPYFTHYPTKIAPDITWGYHVAPVVLVQKDTGVDTLVVDPALSEQLINYKEWMRLQIQEDGSTYFTFLDGSLISFQTESQYKTATGLFCNNCAGNDIVTGIFYDDKYSIENQWIEKSISKGKVYMEYYRDEIIPLLGKLYQFSYMDKDPYVLLLASQIADMKTIISDESNLEKLPKSYQEKYGEYVKRAKEELFGY